MSEFFKGPHHTGATELVVAEGDVGVAEVGEEGTGLVGEGGVDFHEDLTSRDENFTSDAGDGAVEAERVFIGHEEGQRGFMIQYGGVHLCRLGGADVGRVGYEN